MGSAVSPLDGCLTMKEAARYLDTSVATIHRMMKRGDLGYIQVKGSCRKYFRESELRSLIQVRPARVVYMPHEIRQVRHG